MRFGEIPTTEAEGATAHSLRFARYRAKGRILSAPISTPSPPPGWRASTSRGSNKDLRETQRPTDRRRRQGG